METFSAPNAIYLNTLYILKSIAISFRNGSHQFRFLFILFILRLQLPQTDLDALDPNCRRFRLENGESLAEIDEVSVIFISKYLMEHLHRMPHNLHKAVNRNRLHFRSTFFKCSEQYFFLKKCKDVTQMMFDDV